MIKYIIRIYHTNTPKPEKFKLLQAGFQQFSIQGWKVDLSKTPIKKIRKRTGYQFLWCRPSYRNNVTFQLFYSPCMMSLIQWRRIFHSLWNQSIICRKNQLTGFYMTGTMAANELSQIAFTCLNAAKKQ